MQPMGLLLKALIGVLLINLYVCLILHAANLAVGLVCMSRVVCRGNVEE